jgi:hypothetical protein
MSKLIILVFACIIATPLFSQDSFYLKVHFLYGSTPKRAFKATEPKWFGGKLGGHVGIESDSNRILNFVPNGSFHVFSKNKNRHSKYLEHAEQSFYGILGGNPDSVKKTIVLVPVSTLQKRMFDSIAACYLVKTPYDYAFFGMRCGAASYEVLAQLGVLKKYSYRKTYWKIFYPRKLRKRLLKKAKQNGWPVIEQQGSSKRKWEGD